MANESGGGRAIPVLAVLGILFFLVTVAVLIRSGDSDSDRDVATGPAVTTPVVSPQVETPVEPQVEAPVGAVATGGGGTAGDSASLALPVVAVAAALTMLTAGGMVLRRRVA